MHVAPTRRLARVIRTCASSLLFAVLLCSAVRAQPRVVDIARQSIARLDGGMTSQNIAIYGVTLGMSWGEARSILDRAGIPYIFQKGTSPVVYLPPQQSCFYFVLNPSSYDVIEMGIVGSAGLPLENQFLFDGQRWKLTTARTQFFLTEGEFIINEEGESFNFPTKGFVLKYLSPGAFRFVMVVPTNKPLTTKAQQQAQADGPPRETRQTVTVTVRKDEETGSGGQTDDLDAQFARARALFENKEYAQGLAIFRRLSEQHALPLLRIRSIYWMGECLYGMKDYADARAQFRRVLGETDIPELVKSSKTMIGQCNAKLKR